MIYSQDYTSIHIPIWRQELSKFKDKPCRMLELGVFEGRSSVWFLENILTHAESKLYVVDTFEGGADQVGVIDCQNIREKFLENTRPYSKKIKTYIGKSEDMLPTIQDHFDIIYIDASHLVWDVLSDLVLSWKLLKQGGILMMDDVEWSGDSEVWRRPRVAVDAWLQCNKTRFNLIHMGNICIVEKI